MRGENSIRGVRGRRAAAALLLIGTLLLSGCTEKVSQRCSGSDFTVTCTVTYEKSEGQWSTDLEGERRHTEVTISGTFTVTSGSGTLEIEHADGVEEFPLSADEPVEISDLTLPLIEPRDADDEDTRVVLYTRTDGTFDRFSAEYTFETR